MSAEGTPLTVLRPPSALVSVLHNLGWLLAGKGVGGVLSLVYLAVVARTLGAAGFGQFTLIQSTGQAIAAFVGFQTWQVVVRYGAPHLQHHDHGRLQRLIAFCTGLDLAAGLAGCVLSLAAIALLAPYFNWSTRLCIEAVTYCCVTLLSIRSTAVGVLRLYSRFGAGAAADAATPMVRFAGSLVVAIHPSVTGFLIVWAASEAVTAIAYWSIARRVARPDLALPTLRGATQAPAEAPGIWQFTWVTNIGVTLNAIARQVAVLVVGLGAGPVAAGNYRLAYQLSQSLLRVSEMAARASFPEFARTHAGGAYTQLRRLARDLTRLAAIGALVALLVVLAGRPALALIAGKGHQGAYVPLQILGVAAAIELAGVAFEPMLTAIGRARQALMLRIAATVVLGLGIAALLPAYGANGVAMATLIASLCASVLLGLATFRALRSLR